MEKKSREEWEKRVDELKASGLTVDKFAEKHGLNVNSLKNWKYRIAKANKLTKEGKNDRPKEKKGTPTPVTGGSITIVLKSGHKIDLSPDIDTEALKKLVAALGGG